MSKQTCHYIVRANIVLPNKYIGEIVFQNIEHQFSNENPILAREAAFDYYDSYIHGLLLGIGLTDDEVINITDRDVRTLLNPYIDPKTSTEVELLGEKFIIPDYIGNGIWVEMVIDAEVENKLVIHSITYDSSDIPMPPSKIDLESEYEFYITNNYDTKDYKRTIIYIPDEEYEEDDQTFLETPFDWTGYDSKYWWEKSNSEETTIEEQVSKDYNLMPTMEEALGRGECEYTEFKPGLINRASSNRNIELEVAKTLCAFYNSKGGYLFIGISDKKEVVYGLDFSEISKDEFLRQFTRIKTMYLPPSIVLTTYGGFFEYKGKEIFVVSVMPSLKEPIFLWKRDENNKIIKEFYVRSDASSRHLYDLEELVKYCRNRWK